MNTWDALINDVQERIWDELCEQVDMSYIEADDLEMTAVAASVVHLVCAELEIRHLLKHGWQQRMLKSTEQ